MELIKYSALNEEPWRNGLGTTRQIVIWPLTADLSNFEWRVSAAAIIFPGSFSHYPGVSRSLSVLSGKSAELKLGDAQKTLAYQGPVVTFDGGDHAEVLSADGPVLDYNVMSRDEAVSHELACVTLKNGEVYNRKGDFTLITVFEGCELIFEGDVVPLAQYDSVLFKERDGADIVFTGQAEKDVCMLVTEVTKK